ncbi:MAG: hypothetical protein CL928_19455 [Deltaproteobacteria bacterium]|nr:hypothetical protein [Deltaproteobacteria bacterium]
MSRRWPLLLALVWGLCMASCLPWPDNGSPAGDDTGDDDTGDGDTGDATGDDDAGDDDTGDDDAGDDDAGDDDAGDDDDSTPPGPDSDGDGSPDSVDCAPNDSTIYPGAPELCDGEDSDCGGEQEEVASADPQEMFITNGGRLYVTVTSVDADCEIRIDLTEPHVITNLVGKAGDVEGQVFDIGPIPSCSVLEFVVTSCGTGYSSNDQDAVRITPIRTQGWRLEHDDQQFDPLSPFGPDFNDCIFEAEVLED